MNLRQPMLIVLSLLVLTSHAFGIVLELRPVSSTSTYRIVENEIRIPRGGVGITLEIFLDAEGATLQGIQAVLIQRATRMIRQVRSAR